MKNFCIIFLLSIIISLTALGFSDESGLKTNVNSYMVGSFLENNGANEEYLRIHIRADSNEPQAQSV